MGFTFSHPALILPFRFLPRKFYSITGLVIGSIVPDFEYFIRLDNDSSFSHSFSGIFLFDLPLALLISIVYHQLIRDTLINNLPAFLKSRLYKFRQVDWIGYLKNNLAIVICSIIVGSLTHLFWDSYTSYGGYFVRDNALMMTKLNLAGTEIYFYKIIKHLSSLIGGMFLIICLFKLPREEKYSSPGNKFYWPSLAVLFFIFIFLLLFFTKNHLSINSFVKKNISSSLIALIFISLYYKVTNSYK